MTVVQAKRLFKNLNRPRVQNSRRPGQASLASADPGPITTDVCCYAKLGLQRASASASISGYGSPLSRGRQVQAKRLGRRSSTSEGGSDEATPASTRLARSCRRPLRFLGGAMRGSPGRGARPPLGRAPAFQALLKRIHQADDVARPFLALGDLDRLAGGLALDQRLQRILVLVLVFRQVEMPGLGIEDMAGEYDRVLRYLRILDVVKIFKFVTYLVGISQRNAEQAFAERLDRNDMLAIGQDDACKRDAPLVLHGIANHRECVDAGLAVGRDVIGAIDVALVDLLHRYKAVNVDGMGTFDLNGFQLFLGNLDVLALFQLITAGLLFALDHVAGLGVDHLLLQAVAGLLVDHVEVGFFDRCVGRIKRQRARDEGKF